MLVDVDFGKFEDQVVLKHLETIDDCVEEEHEWVARLSDQGESKYEGEDCEKAVIEHEISINLLEYAGTSFCLIFSPLHNFLID